MKKRIENLTDREIEVVWVAYWRLIQAMDDAPCPAGTKESVYSESDKVLIKTGMNAAVDMMSDLVIGLCIEGMESDKYVEMEVEECDTEPS